MNTDRPKRYGSWGQAFREYSPLYLLPERIFLCLSYLSLMDICFHVTRRATWVSAPKFFQPHADYGRLLFFVSLGIILPLLIMITNVGPNALFSVVGVYLTILIIQHHVNLVLFDHFRSVKLPLPRGKRRFSKALFMYCRIFPADLKHGRRANIIRDSRRTFILSIIDYYLFFIGFSLIYWSFELKFFVNTIPYKGESVALTYDLALYFTVVVGTTLGFGEITPNGTGSIIVVIFHVFLSFLFALVIISYAIRLLPQPRTLLDDDEGE